MNEYSVVLPLPQEGAVESLVNAHRLLVEQVIRAAYKASQEDGAIKVPVIVFGCEVYVMKAPGT